MISIRHIIKELFVEKTRLFLTILAVAWGTTAITSMLAIGESLRDTFVRAMSGVGNGVIIVKGGVTTTNYNGLAINHQITLNQQDYNRIKQGITAIKTISPEYDTASINMQYKQKKFSGMVMAVNPSFGDMRNIITQKGGRFIQALDMQQRRRVIVLGNDLAPLFFKNIDNPVGKVMTLGGKPFLVIGVMQKKFQMTGSPDNYHAWIPSSTYIMLAQPTKIDSIVLVPKNLNAVNLIQEQIRTLIADQKNLDPKDKNIVKFRDFADIQTSTKMIFTGLEIFLGLVGVLTLIVAGVGIANVMLISVSRATREIGIRMAIGARSYQVLMHYVLEALIATAIGGVIGIIATEILIYGIKLIPVHGRFFEMIGKPNPELSPLAILIVITVLGLVGFFSGIFPARKASMIDPAEALRH